MAGEAGEECLAGELERGGGEGRRKSAGLFGHALAAVLCLVLIIGLNLPIIGLNQAKAAGAPAIAAASDLRFALTEVVDLFTRQTGRTVRLTFGSSGNMARQIAQGAPFQVFFSASEDYVQFLAEKSLIVGDGALYAIGRLVLFVSAGSPLGSPGDFGRALDGLERALDQGQGVRFAIANPEHAPYGRAAEQTLTSAGLWDKIRRRLVIGENASQAAQFAASGSTVGGLIPYSLAVVPAMGERGTFVLVPAGSHAPLRQRMALIKGAGETARLFYAFVQQPPARAVLKRYGFDVPAGG